MIRLRRVVEAPVDEDLGNSAGRLEFRVSGTDIVRSYVAALGGTIDIVAKLGDRTWKVA